MMNKIFEGCLARVPLEIKEAVSRNVDVKIGRRTRRHTYTPQNIARLQRNEVFVFGSNRAGKHYGGAARVAWEKFGAQWGVGEGHTGQSYALPTLDENGNRVTKEELEKSFAKLIEYADCNRQLIFLVTKIGCGIAGWNIEEVKRCFWQGAKRVSPDDSLNLLPNNVVIPKEFLRVG